MGAGGGGGSAWVCCGCPGMMCGLCVFAGFVGFLVMLEVHGYVARVFGLDLWVRRVNGDGFGCGSPVF